MAAIISRRKMAHSISSAVGPGAGLGLSFMAGRCTDGPEIARAKTTSRVKLRPSLLLRRPGSDGPGRGPGASHPWDPKSCLCWPFSPQSGQKKGRPFRGGPEVRESGLLGDVGPGSGIAVTNDLGHVAMGDIIGGAV